MGYEQSLSQTLELKYIFGVTQVHVTKNVTFNCRSVNRDHMEGELYLFLQTALVYAT